MPSPGELVEQHRDMIPRRVRGTTRRGFVFDPGACKCQNIKCPCRRSRCVGGEPVRASSEAEPHPRGRPAIERGGTSPEGATSPRARRRRASVALCPSSEAEFHPRVAGPTILAGRWGHQGRGPQLLGRDFLSMFLVGEFVCVLFFAKVNGFPPVFWGTLIAVPDSSPRALR
jgi:hypothetical protein